VDDDGVDKGQPVRIRATVTIDAKEMLVDFTGSAAAVRGPINIPFGLTMGVAALVFKSITTADTPANEGNFRPLRVVAPPGSLMHAVPPAPTFTLWPGVLAAEVIIKALAQGMPERVPACSGGDLCTFMGVGEDPVSGKLWLEANNEGVGFGAHAGGDGENGIMHLTEPGCQNVPVEVLETKAPLRVEQYALRPDSGGAGRYRGGLGITRAIRFLAPAAALTLVKKTQTMPWGLGEGEEGENCHVVLRPGTPREETTGMVYEHMAAGDVLVNCSGGGGGWGDAYERAPEQVQADVRNGYVTIEQAREKYGVVIDPAGFEIDLEATRESRSRRPRRTGADA
jgi:N-methylhydantoinase B